MAVERIAPPSEGFDSHSAPWAVKAGAAETSVNLLPGFPGKAPVRGGMTRSEAFNAGADTARPTAIWTAAKGSLVAYRNAAYLGGVGLRAVKADFTGTNSPAAAVNYPDGAFVNVGSQVYGVGDIDSGLGTNKMLRWDGEISSPLSVLKYVNMPGGVIVGIAHWLERLFVLVKRGTAGSAGTSYAGGNAPVSSDTVLQWSDPFDPSTTLPDTLAAWQDDISGLTNQQYISNEGRPYKPVGLTRIGQSLAVVGADSIHMVRGTAPSNWVTRRDVADRGAISAEAFAEYDDGIFFVSYDGVYYYDGAQLIDFSAKSKSKFVPGSYTSAQVVKLDRDYIAVTLRPTLVTDPAVWAGILHVPSQSWTEFKTDTAVFTGGYPSNITRAPFGPVLADYRRLWLGDSLTRPTVSPGQDVSDTATSPVVAETSSRTVRLAQPLTKAKLRRLVVDYVQAPTAGSAPAGTGWQFDVLDPTDQTTLFTQDETLTSDSVAGKRHRHVAEANVEVDEVKVKATFTGSATVGIRGELHETWLEFDPAQQGSSF